MKILRENGNEADTVLLWHGIFNYVKNLKIRFHFFSQMLPAHKEGNQIVM